MIKLENVSKYYKDFPAVLDVSFEIGRGEVFGFIRAKRGREDHHDQDVLDSYASDRW